jgi:hypothetical protein
VRQRNKGQFSRENDVHGEAPGIQPEFKLSAVKRVMAGERLASLAQELGVPSGHIYSWVHHNRQGGAEALRPACRARKGFGVLARDDFISARVRHG